MIPMIMANDRQPMISYLCLVVFAMDMDILTTYFLRSGPFRPLSVVVGTR